MDINNYLNIIKKRLEKNFDLIFDYSINNHEIDLFGKFNMKTERYILTKKTVIDTMENNEYCFIKYFNNLNKAYLEDYTDFLIKSIDTLVKPNRDHMSSIITGVLVVENKPNEEFIDFIEKFKYHKGFAFGFNGWVDIRLILVAMKDNYIVTNKKGKEVKKVYQF
ncbi:MAG: hypothetical protein GX981_04005 [Tissierellia bacterium]|nr:hypothetical protein [Tissierellia bacterium]